MKFIEIIRDKKFFIISLILFLYIVLNLFDGQRGLISYFEKEKKINLLFEERENFTQKLRLIEKKNKLLTETIDTDYLEVLYRTKFMRGKKNEKVFVE